jgi:hypothetical protein
MKTARSVAFLCCVLALPALPAGADPRPIDPACQSGGPPAAVGQPGRSTVPIVDAVEPDELGDGVRCAVPDGSVALHVPRRATPSIREILVMLLEANALVMLLVFMVLQRWRRAVIPRLLTSAEHLIRRRRAAHRMGRLAGSVWPADLK